MGEITEMPTWVAQGVEEGLEKEAVLAGLDRHLVDAK
jgi:hypothetical protein